MRDFLFRRTRESRRFRFIPHDPLVDQTVQNLGVAFRLAVHELLVTAQDAHFAQQYDVALDAGGDAVDDFLRRHRPRGRQRQQGTSQTKNDANALHQNVDPKLKKIWKPGSRVLCNHLAIQAGRLRPGADGRHELRAIDRKAEVDANRTHGRGVSEADAHRMSKIVQFVRAVIFANRRIRGIEDGLRRIRAKGDSAQAAVHIPAVVKNRPAKRGSDVRQAHRETKFLVECQQGLPADRKSQSNRAGRPGSTQNRAATCRRPRRTAPAAESRVDWRSLRQETSAIRCRDTAPEFRCASNARN